MPTREVDLRQISYQLAEILGDEGLTIHLFGSRRHQTGSVRSDVDLLITREAPISQAEAQRIWELEPYVDAFWQSRGQAVSVINESRVSARDLAALIDKLDAVLIYEDGDWTGDTAVVKHEVLAERNPGATVFPMYDLDDAVPAERADLLVITALTEEFDAVSIALTGWCHDADFTADVQDESRAPWRVRVVNVHKMGSISMALHTYEALRRTKAAHAILVGICGGIPKRAGLVDVIVPTSVVYYEPSKLRGVEVETAPEFALCDEGIARRASNLRLPKHLSVLADSVVMGSGEKVIASDEARDYLVAKLHRKLAGVDMESYGFLQAVALYKRRGTVIKAVSDMADEAKSDSEHGRAAAAAAEVLHLLIKQKAFAAAK